MIAAGLQIKLRKRYVRTIDSSHIPRFSQTFTAM